MFVLTVRAFTHMIIGIDASRANRKEKTGVEFYAFFLIEELKKFQISDFPAQGGSASGGRFQISGEPVRFVLYSSEPLMGDLGKLPDHWEARVLKWPPKRFWTQIRLSWEMLVRPPDVLFVPAHVFPIIHPKKTVMTVHDIAVARFPESYNWFEKWYSLFSAKMAVKKLWKVIVPSQLVKNELISDFRFQILDFGKLVDIPHGYDDRYRKIENEIEIEEVLNKYGIRKPFLLSVGRLETKKNTRRIIEAFNQLSNQQSSIINQLVLIGKPGHGYQDVVQAYSESPCKDRILMPGYVDPEDLVYIMNAAEVFIFPSLYEGFGLPVLEAMASGTPVVAGKGSSLEEVGGGACLYVDPLSADDIARGIKIIMQNAELRMQNVVNGLERVKMFSWEKCARKALAVLLN